MTTPFTEILVFKTNIVREDDVQKIMEQMNGEQRIVRWTVDRSDCDKVLRVESHDIDPNEVIGILNAAGYRCEELV